MHSFDRTSDTTYFVRLCAHIDYLDLYLILSAYLHVLGCQYYYVLIMQAQKLTDHSGISLFEILLVKIQLKSEKKGSVNKQAQHK